MGATLLSGALPRNDLLTVPSNGARLLLLFIYPALRSSGQTATRHGEATTSTTVAQSGHFTTSSTAPAPWPYHDDFNHTKAKPSATTATMKPPQHHKPRKHDGHLSCTQGGRLGCWMQKSLHTTQHSWYQQPNLHTGPRPRQRARRRLWTGHSTRAPASLAKPQSRKGRAREASVCTIHLVLSGTRKM